ncbi:MAG TPA: nucleotide exchange factor GrpE [Micromonosporaceae bacterium]|nr:nucleotide exchange factor GrpE [Micromonosporaceae bacterium]
MRVQSNRGDTTDTVATHTGPTNDTAPAAEPEPTTDVRPATQIGAGSPDASLATPPPEPDTVGPLLAELQAIRAELGVLATREQERAAHRETVIDRLHAENQTLRQRDLYVMLEPVRSTLYRLYDLARREADRWSGPTPPAIEHAGPLLGVIAEELSEVLAGTGVESFTPQPGDPYDPTRHRPVDTADIADAALDGTVVKALSDGFTRGETIARRADVVIGQLRTHQWTRPRSGG